LIVVAQITLIVHLAKAGFSIFHISIDHSVLPAHTTVWISSIKRMILPSDFSTSFNIAFNLSSKSHLYLLQAIKDPISSSIIFLSFNKSGTSHFTISWAKSSMIAVFHTHGSQTSTGLFFVLRERICKTLLSSSSLQITGSSFPFSAKRVISFQYLESTSRLTSGSLVSTLSQFLMLSITALISSYFTHNLFSIQETLLSHFKIANKKCSVVI
jgi:hypothetical protein